MTLQNVMDVPQSCAKSTQPPPKSFVRYIGMVQDMTEAEYFTTTGSHGSRSNNNNNISERTPMMLLTIPTLHHYKNSNIHVPTRDTTYPSKRMRMDDISTTTIATSNTNVATANDEFGGPVRNVVANFYFDHYPSTASTTATNSRSFSLQLNQMVEILGIVEEQPEDEDEAIGTGTVSDDDKMEEDDANVHPTGNMYYNDDLYANGALENSEASDGISNCQSTNHTFVPRIHVLWYRIVNLDDVEENCSSSSSSNGNNNSNDMLPSSQIPATTASTTELSSSVSLSASSLLLYQAWMNLGLGNDTTTGSSITKDYNHHSDWQTLAQAIWILMHSKTEQQLVPASQTNGVKPILGCASLNVIVPSVDGSDDDPVVLLLTSTVEALVHPHCCHTITLDNKNSSTVMDHLQAPQKMFGRMKSSALQLPAGSTLIVDVRKYDKNTKDNNAATQEIPNYENPNHPLYAIRHICRYFQLPYKFDGGIEIPFLADYRVIVISNPKTQHLIPCTMTIPAPILPSSSPTTTLGPDAFTEHLSVSPILLNLRDTLRTNRSLQASTTIRLHDTVIERAQQDFCNRRRQFYDDKDDNIDGVVPTQPKVLIGEHDFHRWLILCRLITRCRGITATIAEIFDWEQAIQFDDTARKVMNANLSL
jgi:hypothetical protein